MTLPKRFARSESPRACLPICPPFLAYRIIFRRVLVFLDRCLSQSIVIFCAAPFPRSVPLAPWHPSTAPARCCLRCESATCVFSVCHCCSQSVRASDLAYLLRFASHPSGRSRPLSPQHPRSGNPGSLFHLFPDTPHPRPSCFESPTLFL